MQSGQIQFSNYPLAGIASIGATAITNPLEVSTFDNREQIQRCHTHIFIDNVHLIFICDRTTKPGDKNTSSTPRRATKAKFKCESVPRCVACILSSG